MTRRDLELVSDALGQAQAYAQRMKEADMVHGVALVRENIITALLRVNPSFQGDRFREAVRKAADQTVPHGHVLCGGPGEEKTYQGTRAGCPLCSPGVK